MFCILVLVFVASSFAQTCRSFSSCNACLQDPECGWCNSAKVCVPGNLTGPSFGSCSDWDFYNCDHTAPPSSDWPCFGGGNSRSGFRSVSLGQVKPSQLWRASFGGLMSSSSILVDNVVYAVGGSGGFSNQTLLLFGLDAKTGKQVFQVSLGQASSFSAPAASADRSMLFVQTVGVNEGIIVYAVNIPKQQIAWRGQGSSQWAQYPYGPLVTLSGDLFFLDGEYNGQVHRYSNGSSAYDVALYGTSAGCDYSTLTLWSQQPDLIYWTTAPGEGNGAVVGAINRTSGESVFQIPLSADWDGYSTYR